MGEAPSDIEQIEMPPGGGGEVRPWVRRMEPVSKGAGLWPGTTRGSATLGAEAGAIG